MHDFLRKLRDVAFSVSLIVIFVLVINVGVVHVEWKYIGQFLIGALCVFLGLSIFLLGVDISITPIGDHMGKLMTRSNRKWIIAAGSLVLGFMVAFAEPALMVYGQQVEAVTGGMLASILLVAVVAIGIGLLVAVAALRIVKGFSIKILFFILYLIIFILALFVSSNYLAITFDAAAAVTGSLVVPFLLALTVGIAAFKSKQGSAEEDSFGLLGVATTGAIIATLFLGIFTNTKNLESGGAVGSAEIAFLPTLFRSMRDVSFSILPIIFMFIAAQIFKPKFSKKKNLRVFKGLIYAFIGLTIFLTGVNGGFMTIGRLVGKNLSLNAPDYVIFIIGFLLGMLIVLTEPAVHVQTAMIEDITSRSIKRRIILIALAIGNGIAIGLSMIRILNPEVQIWHFLLPGYLIAIVLTFFAPKIFVGIAFDSGGVASGPLTVTFMLAFCQGIASGTGGAATLIDGFGMITMAALMPLIALQLLGVIYKIKLKKNPSREE